MTNLSHLDFATHPIPAATSTLKDNNASEENQEYISHLAAIVESSEDAIISKSLDGTIKTWNKGSEKMFGFTAKEAVGKNISIIIPLEYVKEEENIIKKISNNEVIGSYETVRNKKNGEHFYVSLTLSPLKDGAGNIIGVSKIARDITFRKKSEAELSNTYKELENTTEALKQSNDLFFKLFNYNPAAIAIANVVDGKLININGAFLKLFGFPNKQEVIGKSSLELNLVSPEQSNLIHLSAEYEIAKHYEVEAQTKEGKKLCVSTSVLRLDIDGTPCVISVIIDITGLKKIEEQLKMNIKELAFQNKEKEKRAAELIVANKELIFQNNEKEKRAKDLIIANKELVFQNAEKEKRADELNIANEELIIIENQLKEVNKELEAFSYSVSHDLRAPLRAISGYSIMLQEDYQPSLDAEANRIINVIVDNTRMMSRLIDDLLSFSRMARLEVADDSIDMKKIAEKCVDELTQMDKQKRNSITILSMNECKGDASMLKQVWYNLINNALKYSSKKSNSKIEAGMMADEKRNIYYVKDYGSGFDMRYSGKLFGVFQRLHRQDEFEGTGLGLALAKRIINKHHGEIWAESILNEGATFYFSIPKSI